MGKPRKDTPETVKKLLDAVRFGYTVKAACKLAGITDMTLSRWRRKNPKFAQAFTKATEEQLERGRKALKSHHIRTYSRGMQKLSSQSQISLIEPIRSSQDQYNHDDGNAESYEGLPVRFGSITDDKPYQPCINAYNGRVEYLKWERGRNVLHTCSPDVFRRSHPAWYRQMAEQCWSS